MSWQDIMGIACGVVISIYIIGVAIWFIRDHIREKKKPMTNLEKIKTLDAEQMAEFLTYVELQEVVGKRVFCDKSICASCDENYVCFIEWLNAEAKYEEGTSAIRGW